MDKQHGGHINNQAGVGKQFLQQCHNWQVLITTEAFANGKSRWKGNCLCLKTGLGAIIVEALLIRSLQLA